ncbi:MAG TPA: transcription-repair coupling factor [Desulfobacteraceae bacterium]|nr:transcription-repair coupling factor [Desulfobacteraceae bacterium]
MTDAFFKSLAEERRSIVSMKGDGAPKAWFTAEYFQRQDRPLVMILPDAKAARAFMDDLAFFMPEKEDRIIYFPGYNILPFKSLSYHRETSTSRLAALSRIMDGGTAPYLVVTHVDTLLQYLIPRKVVSNVSELLMANEETDRDSLVANLEAGGYSRVSLVEDPGEYAVRGGILDVFSPGEDKPVRIEFFGDLVESIRTFSPFTQRGIKELGETIILPATEAVISEDEQPNVLARLRKAGTRAGLAAADIREYVTQTREFGRFPGIESMLSIVYDELDTLFDYLPRHAVFLLDDPELLASRASDFTTKARLNYDTVTQENRLCVEPDSVYMDWEKVTDKIGSHRTLAFQQVVFETDRSDACVVDFPYRDTQELAAGLRAQGKSDNPLRPLVEWLSAQEADGRKVLCTVSGDAQAKRLVSLLAPYGITPALCKTFHAFSEEKTGIYYTISSLSSGFTPELSDFSLVTENEIFGKKIIRRQKASHRNLKTEFIAPEELKNGDIVVHLEHGVGRYEGLCSLTVSGISQDFILIVYQDEDKLYLPVDRMEMIGKYVGVDGYSPVLDKIGSKSWVKSKAKAKAEVEKMAADLLDLYAKRRVNKGFSFSRPDNYYNDFEASFPYEETRDQLRAIDDVHLDMEKDTPMDRLVCGDVGYGKTEVAIRAAFKAVNDGKQVAIVVPTTILAEQHLHTFRERFTNYPVTIECLSRFRSRKEQTDILKRTGAGKVDIVIGTHRLLQKDVDFSSLGLLVIDEEQRFGVKHKEVLKKKRSTVDVLSLSATPIPRTLHMSLTGMRDISVITTPPAARQPIISYISKYEDAIVGDAVRREISRGGQVFFVHNNIKTIFKTAENLKNIIPSAKIGVAHGRLSETELEKVMLQFVNNEIDLLVCTTIIESGLDIPSANTMIINKAERFGLSQIYQLRGRIGRGDHQAYAYLFISDESRLTKDAKKRLAALMEHRDLGSGFQIAMKDLQIRGAGTALGASQSGHIAAVGYDMFLKLLDQAVKDIKGEDVLDPLDPEINASMSSGFPEAYIESVEQRLTLYRRLSRLSRVSDISDMKQELIDRYGPLPKPAENMLLKIMLRIYAIKAGVKRLDLSPNTLTLEFSLPHMRRPVEQLVRHLDQTADYKFIKKESVRITLGRKRNNISRALLETKQILQRIA